MLELTPGPDFDKKGVPILVSLLSPEREPTAIECHSSPLPFQTHLKDLISNNDDARCHAASWGQFRGPRCHGPALSAFLQGFPVATQNPKLGPKVLKGRQVYRMLEAIP